ncbi:velvet domain-containing protein [Favolaschia claudopus]|uniref:Velvet domain-containing protein n=1 Tax=Favolaschia claudopus TaxID=2862362 RepID=A0AAW0CCT7_9AGAR
MHPVPSSSAYLVHSELAAPPLQLQLGEYFARPCLSLPAPDSIGLPRYFTNGWFAGKTIRAELEEVQRPQYGRRFGKVDRRVLDDPPVVSLRIFDVCNAGTRMEREQEMNDYDDIPLAGLMCMTDLFEVKQSQPPPPNSSEFSSNSASPYSVEETFVYPPRSPPSPPPLPRAVLTTVDGYDVMEDSNRTTALFGSKFAEPHRVQMPGKIHKQLVFVFSDLAVRLEGTFLLRYRFFDIFSKSGSNGSASSMLAECYGRPFPIYSSKYAPPLLESTELTKCLADQGVTVKVREKARSPRKKNSP